VCVYCIFIESISGNMRGSCSSSGSSDTSASLSEHNALTPLFVHLVCSVRFSSSLLSSTSVLHLPMCLGKLAVCTCVYVVAEVLVFEMCNVHFSSFLAIFFLLLLIFDYHILYS